jgi:hypothetical protein
MKKRLSIEEKKQQAFIDLINKMFQIAGHNVTYDDIKDRKDDWYREWTMTVEQSNEWRRWGEAHFKKLFKWNKKVCEREMGWINLSYGLKFSNFEEYHSKNETK